MTNLNILPRWTLTRQGHYLSASCPVRVRTYVFGTSARFAEGIIDPCSVCGPVQFHSGHHSIEPHDHDHYEIEFITAGSVIYETERGRQSLSAGSVLAIEPGEVHAYHNIQDLQIVNCSYLSEWLVGDLSQLIAEEKLVLLFLHASLYSGIRRSWAPEFPIDSEAWRGCSREMMDIAEECERSRPSKIFLKSALIKLMMLLGRASASLHPNSMFGWDHRVSRLMERIEQLINEGTPPNLGVVAKELRISQSQLWRIFKEVTGSSPMDYYQNRRIQHACWMLLNSSRTITEIAHVLGYSDSAHFNHFFKRIRGQTPLQYRRKYVS